MKRARFQWKLGLGVWLFAAGVARAHEEQTRPSEIEIYPRQNSLTVLLRGNSADLRDVVAAQKHGGHGHDAPVSLLHSEQAAARRYLETHLFLEQGGQLLPLKSQNARFDVQEFGDAGETRFEVILRAARPQELAETPLQVASNLFGALDGAQTLVSLNGETKVLKGEQIAEFAAPTTISTTASDRRDFFWSGARHPVAGFSMLFFLLALCLAGSLLSPRVVLASFAAMVGAYALSFGLALDGVWETPTLWASLGLASAIVLMNFTVGFLAQRGDQNQHIFLWLAIAFSAWAGASYGASGVIAPRILGLPEENLGICGVAFVAGAAVMMGLILLAAWPILQLLKRKFVHQGQYGGMNWPRAVQIAALTDGIWSVFPGLLGIGN